VSKTERVNTIIAPPALSTEELQFISMALAAIWMETAHALQLEMSASRFADFQKRVLDGDLSAFFRSFPAPGATPEAKAFVEKTLRSLMPIDIVPNEARH
jgi:hypothetical protein